MNWIWSCVRYKHVLCVQTLAHPTVIFDIFHFTIVEINRFKGHTRTHTHTHIHTISKVCKQQSLCLYGEQCAPNIQPSNWLLKFNSKAYLCRLSICLHFFSHRFFFLSWAFENSELSSLQFTHNSQFSILLYCFRWLCVCVFFCLLLPEEAPFIVVEFECVFCLHCILFFLLSRNLQWDEWQKTTDTRFIRRISSKYWSPNARKRCIRTNTQRTNKISRSVEVRK